MLEGRFGSLGQGAKAGPNLGYIPPLCAGRQADGWCAPSVPGSATSATCRETAETGSERAVMGGEIGQMESAAGRLGPVACEHLLMFAQLVSK